MIPEMKKRMTIAAAALLCLCISAGAHEKRELDYSMHGKRTANLPQFK